MPKTPERVKYLTDVLTTAIENGGYGFFYVEEYELEPDPYAVIVDSYEGTGKRWRVNLDTIAKGLGVIRKAVMREVTDSLGMTDDVLHNADTGQRLYVHPDMRTRLLKTSDDNDADMDAIDALAILECALFGAVTYA